MQILPAVVSVTLLLGVIAGVTLDFMFHGRIKSAGVLWVLVALTTGVVLGAAVAGLR